MALAKMLWCAEQARFILGFNIYSQHHYVCMYT
jgi:hypothetical protein